ncbi:SDR family NAD(P)-dependent oxidoreductase [Pseudomonas piscis]|uniref:SDR family NAD(P)-dependent oxidoreductase n=1 Tax=Pseudomonas piscis TaxID=2614538 RepID=A0A7X1PQH4_9PSED|nr:SDR family oxidoreductase [Pseudomonas piscis]MQA55435.1 SDR family NAD(P)-dependent oxidoreductase [Pseudomonas piscis]
MIGRMGPAVTLKGAVVLITGAAGALGGDVALRLASRGAKLALADRDEAGLDRLINDCALHKVVARKFVVDLLDSEQLLALPDRVEQTLGPIDVFVSSAGIEINACLHTISPQEIDVQLGINLRGPMVLTSKIVPGMRARKRGHVVIISSMSGKVFLPAKSVYAAAKAGSLAFAHALRRELVGTGVTTSVIAPSVVMGAGQAHRAMLGTALDPKKLGAVTIEQCTNAVLDALDRQLSEVTVTGRPSGILTAVQAVWPGLADLIIRMSGVDQFGLVTAEKNGRR